MTTVMVTGGSGFFGGVLKRRLLREGFRVVNVDLVADADLAAGADGRGGAGAGGSGFPELRSVVGDIRDEVLMERLFAEERERGTAIEHVMHCAAMLAHEKVPAAELWGSNVDGTRVVGEVARRHGVRTVVFTSTNCLWAEGFGRPVTEADVPKPVELYGRSKLEGERVLRELAAPEEGAGTATSQGRDVGQPGTVAVGEGVGGPTAEGRDVGHGAGGKGPEAEGMAAVIIRCPTIIDSGRLGLLAILFEFIDEGRRVWVVGDGGNRYQFIYAEDLATACLQAMEYGRSDTFHIGSDEVPTLGEVYEEVIRAAGTRARVARLPRGLTVAAMQLAHRAGVSPLGPYHYRMIAESFVFDTTRIRERMGWRPTVTNGEMMVKAYRYYAAKRKELERNRDAVSAHSRPAAMGVIRLLKWIS